MAAFFIITLDNCSGDNAPPLISAETPAYIESLTPSFKSSKFSPNFSVIVSLILPRLAATKAFAPPVTKAFKGSCP